MPLKVLVVDDSALMRKHLCQLFAAAGLEVFSARDGREAVEQVLSREPDVVSLDINMPEVDGLTALSLIMSARPTPVVMVSSLTTKGAAATLEALAMGAVDYIAKPAGTISLSIEAISNELVAKVKAAAKAKVRAPRQSLGDRLRQERERMAQADREKALAPGNGGGDFGLVLIGVSTGGPRTLEEILPQLPGGFPWAVLVAQHMPAAFTGTLAARLGSLCALRVMEVTRPEDIQPSTIYIGRGGADMVVTRRAARVTAAPRPESPHHLWHPSVTLLVESAMAHFPAERLIGVELTGMGHDGAEAMAALHSRGGRTIAESEESAVVFGMPKELIERGGATAVLPACEIASQLTRWLV